MLLIVEGLQTFQVFTCAKGFDRTRSAGDDREPDGWMEFKMVKQSFEVILQLKATISQSLTATTIACPSYM